MGKAFGLSKKALLHIKKNGELAKRISDENDGDWVRKEWKELVDIKNETINSAEIIKNRSDSEFEQFHHSRWYRYFNFDLKSILFHFVQNIKIFKIAK